MKTLLSRRQILSVALTAGAAGSMASLPFNRVQAAPALDKVTETDPVAGALGFVSDVSRLDPKAHPEYQKSANCSNCAWYEPVAGVPAGRCNYFPGKVVDAKAWCRMWSAGPK